MFAARRRSRSQNRTLLLVFAALLVLGLWWWASNTSSSGTAQSGRPTGGSSQQQGQRPPSGAVPQSGLPAIPESKLPPEGQQTLRLIRAGGPFPYSRDGAVFQNREGLLPRHQGGYYHEYTVRTPGESDRGARRIIVGQSGDLYYTQDHYDSFSQIREGT